MSDDRYEELATLWLSQASDDLRWAKDSFDDGHFSGVCFLCQQIVEKALKAYLYSKRQKLIRTHDTERLLEHCIGLDPNFTQIKPACNIVNDYYVDTRYPDIYDVQRFHDKGLAAEGIKQAEAVLEFVRKRVPLSVVTK